MAQWGAGYSGTLPDIEFEEARKRNDEQLEEDMKAMFGTPYK